MLHLLRPLFSPMQALNRDNQANMYLSHSRSLRRAATTEFSVSFTPSLACVIASRLVSSPIARHLISRNPATSLSTCPLSTRVCGTAVHNVSVDHPFTSFARYLRFRDHCPRPLCRRHLPFIPVLLFSPLLCIGQLLCLRPPTSYNASTQRQKIICVHY